MLKDACYVAVKILPRHTTDTCHNDKWVEKKWLSIHRSKDRKFTKKTPANNGLDKG